MAKMMTKKTVEEVERFQNLLISVATGGSDVHEEYGELRSFLISDPSVNRRLLPQFVRTCRNVSQFWGFIQPQFPTYKERREFIWEHFRPLLDSLENQVDSPANADISDGLERFDTEHVHAGWTKATERLTDDPEGAITSARSLLESICKYILDRSSESYDANADLPKLYGATARTLNLAPDQHSEQIFKQILGGCTSVVNGLAAVRNRLGDAHGQGIAQVKPSQRHARLAVHLAGAMAVFLMETWETKSQSMPSAD